LLCALAHWRPCSMPCAAGPIPPPSLQFTHWRPCSMVLYGCPPLGSQLHSCSRFAPPLLPPHLCCCTWWGWWCMFVGECGSDGGRVDTPTPSSIPNTDRFPGEDPPSLLPEPRGQTQLCVCILDLGVVGKGPLLVAVPVGGSPLLVAPLNPKRLEPLCSMKQQCCPPPPNIHKSPAKKKGEKRKHR
jgi:hypothetical protein